jgi:uncharacterized protein (DUF1501 family)
MQRRQFLGLGAAVSASLLLGAHALARPASAARRFVWINLRGAMDGLHAVLPTFDKEHGKHRATLLGAVESGLLPLSGGFALHPELKTLHAWFREKTLSPVVAVASPYRERSHFAAQDVLESGLSPADAESGWLARALAASGRAGETGMAIARSVPVVLRGDQAAQTWFPSALPPADLDLYQRLLALYDGDQTLHARLQEGMSTRASLDMSGASPAELRRPSLASLGRACGEMLAENPALCGATLEMGGWDTHNQQMPRLTQQFRQLDAGLAALRAGLGAAWDTTVIAIGTEFGRTVAVNGTGGTDHGTASVMFLAGGAVATGRRAAAGGKVLGDWPGLAAADLHEGRDLRPTSDMRAWLGDALQLAWGLDEAALQRVFPGMAPRPSRAWPAPG